MAPGLAFAPAAPRWSRQSPLTVRTCCPSRPRRLPAGRPRRAHNRALAATTPRAAAAKAGVEKKSGDEEVYIPDPFLAGRAGAVCPDLGWEASRTSGAAKIADSRGVDVPNIARCYGFILAKQMLDLGVEDLMPECIIDGLFLGWDELDSPMDVSRFETLLQGLLAEGESSPDSDASSGGAGDAARTSRSIGEMLSLSQMYGFLLGTTLRMSCLELDVDTVAAGFRAKCGEPDLAMPLAEQQYDRMFMELQQIAAALMYETNRQDADRFFASTIGARDIVRIPGGRVMYLDGRYRAPAGTPAATLKDTVLAVISGRLLDGRAFLVPTFSDGLDREADSVSIPLAGVPEPLSVGIVGMRAGEVRTVYIHPKATDGVSALFSAQPFPPQSLLIFDVKLLSLSPTEAPPPPPPPPPPPADE
jgi:FKBP-type peptidyl-prolyl cis-trans isomerase